MGLKSGLTAVGNSALYLALQGFGSIALLVSVMGSGWAYRDFCYFPTEAAVNGTLGILAGWVLACTAFYVSHVVARSTTGQKAHGVAEKSKRPLYTYLIFVGLGAAVFVYEIATYGQVGPVFGFALLALPLAALAHYVEAHKVTTPLIFRLPSIVAGLLLIPPGLAMAAFGFLNIHKCPESYHGQHVDYVGLFDVFPWLLPYFAWLSPYLRDLGPGLIHTFLVMVPTTIVLSAFFVFWQYRAREAGTHA